MIIERKEAEQLNRTKSWSLVFGRRKTGKTFLIKNFVKFDYYFFVKRDRSVLTENSTLEYTTFMELFKNYLSEEKTIVIDEFHRLPEEFFDFLHYTDKKGRVILVSSTLSLAKKFFLSNSPLLGIFSEVQVSLPSLKETLKASNYLNKNSKEWLEMAILLREPMFIPQMDTTSTKELVVNILSSAKKTIPALVGEIFSEEERTLSMIYEGILRSIAVGKVTSGEISSYLFSRKLIPKDDPSLIQQHLLILVRLGMLKKIKVFNKKRKFVYKHISPMARMFYFCDEKYNFSERDTSSEELLRIVNTIFPHIIEDSVREELARNFGLTETVLEEKDFDVDGILLKFEKPEIALEVKWRENIKKEDLIIAVENLKKFNVKKRILFIPDKKRIGKIDGVEVFDANDLSRQI